MKMCLRLFLVILFSFDHVNSWSPYRRSGSFDSSRGCSFLKCKKEERCVNRTFWCKSQPCPNMMYCAKSQKESLKGPPTCDTVKCSKGYTCIVKVRHCNWNEPCRDEIARCVTNHEYHEGPASCAGFKCPSGQSCILRESLCPRAPCKLFKSCASKQDVHMWMDRCKSLGCISEHECFLRRPEENCGLHFCQHKPDCTATNEEEFLANEKCRGWVCPKNEQCTSQLIGPCQNDNCRIARLCSRADDFYGVNQTDGPFFKPINYFSSNTRKTSWGSGSLNPTSGDLKSTLSPITPWLNHLRVHTGAEAVQSWVKRAEEGREITGFRSWLESVKAMLGVQAFDLWLDEVRTMTVNSRPFQSWLASTLVDSHNSYNSSFNVNQFHESLNPTATWRNQETNFGTPSQTFPHRIGPHGISTSSDDEYFGVYPYQSRRGSFPLNFDHQSEDLKKKKKSFITFLEKLREERHLYLNVINKTQELVSKAQPLFPISHLDDILKKFEENISNGEISLDSGTSGTRRNFPPQENPITDGKNTSSQVEKPGDYSDDEETEFFLVDYGNLPQTQIERNHSIPRIIIKVENSMEHPIKIGDIKLKYEDNQEMSRQLGGNTDDYSEDPHSELPENVTEEKRKKP